MAAVNPDDMTLSTDDLNAMDLWILNFLTEHEWSNPNLIHLFYNDGHENEISRQWVSSRIQRLLEHDHLRKVHEDSSMYELVNDPRD